MSAIKVYGIPNCDTTKAALNWLKQNGQLHTLHNYKTDGISREKLTAWVKALGLDKLLNKRSTTWRSLSATQQQTAATEAGAIALMLENTSLIKRPVVEKGSVLLVGFDEKMFNSNLK